MRTHRLLFTAISALFVVFATVSTVGCPHRTRLEQHEAEQLARVALVERCKAEALDCEGLLPTRSTYMEKDAMWEFYFDVHDRGVDGANVLVDGFRRTEVHLVSAVE